MKALMVRIDAFGDSHLFTAIVVLAFAAGYIASVISWAVKA